jgi:hypothetical protein
MLIDIVRPFLDILGKGGKPAAANDALPHGSLDHETRLVASAIVQGRRLGGCASAQHAIHGAHQLAFVERLLKHNRIG